MTAVCVYVEDVLACVWCVGMCVVCEHLWCTTTTHPVFAHNLHDHHHHHIYPTPPSPQQQQLSASCRDLLNKIFNVDPISRITIPEIIEHPWYNMELPEKYQSVLDRLATQQAEVDAWLASCQIDQTLVDEREDLLRLMVKEAGTQVTERSMHNMGALQIVDYQRQDIKHINLMHAAIEVGSPGIEVRGCFFFVCV